MTQHVVEIYFANPLHVAAERLRITIIGGFPSISLLKDSMSAREFEAYLDKVFSELGSGDHLILGVADTTSLLQTLRGSRTLRSVWRNLAP